MSAPSSQRIRDRLPIEGCLLAMLISPLRRLFNATASYHAGTFRQAVSKILRENITLADGTPAIVYTLTEHPSATALPGTLPSRTPSELVAAYRKWNTCDYSMSVLIEPIRNMFSETGVEVEWLMIEPLFKFILRWENEDARVPYHSVLRLTDTNGISYIADLSFEQFGQDGNDWFCEEAVYMQRYVKQGTLPIVVSTEVEAITRKCAEEASWGFWATMEKTFVAVLSGTDWNIYVESQRQEKWAWMNDILHRIMCCLDYNDIKYATVEPMPQRMFPLDEQLFRTR